MRIVVASALLFLVACASTGRPADIAQPEIAVQQAGPFFFGSQATSDVTIDVRIANRANVPITLREIEVSSSNVEQYYLPRSRRTYKETIAPGETRTVQMPAMVVASADTHPRQAQPVTVRTFLRFEANGKSFREVVLREFAPIP